MYVSASPIVNDRTHNMMEGAWASRDIGMYCVRLMEQVPGYRYLCYWMLGIVLPSNVDGWFMNHNTFSHVPCG